MKTLFKVCLFFLAIFCISKCANAQHNPPQKINSWYQFTGVSHDSVMIMPTVQTPSYYRKTGAQYWNTADSNIYVWTGTQFLCKTCVTTGTLQSVSAAGDSTNTKMYVYADTSYLFHSKMQGATFGDSSLSASDTIVSFGDSWTVGTGVSPTSQGYAYLLASYYGSSLFNRGVNGWTLVSQGAGTSLMENLNLIPVKKGNYRFITFLFGINDSHFGLSSTTFISNYGTVVDTCVSRGWPLSSIIILSPGYNNGTFAPTITTFVNASRTASINKSVQFSNIYAGMQAYGVNGLIGSDSVHPTVPGYFDIAQIAAKGIRGFSLAGSLTTNGLSTFNGLNVYNNNENHIGLAVNPYNTSTIGSGINKATMRLQIGRLNNTFYTSPIRFSPNTLDVAQTFQDSIDFQVYSNGGRIELGFARSAVNFLRFPWQGGAIFNGSAWGSTDKLYAFNAGGLYVNGGTSIHGRDSVYGSVYATGDAISSLDKFLWFNGSGGTIKIGVDIIGTGDFNIFNFNSNFNLGYKASGTFNPLISMHTVGNSVTIGQDSTRDASGSSILNINSTSRGVLVAPRMTTTQKLAIASPTEGLQVFDITLHKLSYFDGTVWVNL